MLPLPAGSSGQDEGQGRGETAPTPRHRPCGMWGDRCSRSITAGGVPQPGRDSNGGGSGGLRRGTAAGWGRPGERRAELRAAVQHPRRGGLPDPSWLSGPSLPPGTSCTGTTAARVPQSHPKPLHPAPEIPPGIAPAADPPAPGHLSPSTPGIAAGPVALGVPSAPCPIPSGVP